MANSRVPGPVGGTSSQPSPVSASQSGQRPLSNSEPQTEQPKIVGKEPTDDGECNFYDIHPYDASIFYPEQSPATSNGFELKKIKRKREPRGSGYPVVFINGQSGNPAKHMYQAIATAVVSGGSVCGVYNSSQGVLDTFHSLLLDKTTSSLVSDLLASASKRIGGEVAAQKALTLRLKKLSSPATASLFDLLCKAEYHNARIVAHSQGNIIACNALNALVSLRGKESILAMKVLAIASPVTFWTNAKNIVKEFTFRNDAIGWASGNFLFPKDKRLNRLPAFLRPHAPDPQQSRLGNCRIIEDEHSQVVLGFEQTRLSFLTHSYFAYVAELWDALIAEFP